MKRREKYNPKLNNMNGFDDDGEIDYVPDKSVEVIDKEILQLFVKMSMKVMVHH